MKTRLSADSLFRAFADETRLRILHLLLGRELCVCDLIAVLRLPQSTVSRHLAYLRRAKLVRFRQAGLWCHYALTPPGGRLHQSLLRCLKGCFEDVPEIRNDRVRLGRIQKNKRCGESER